MKQPAIIIDLDGTLCNAKHRLHHIEKEPKDWDAFFKNAHLDQPNKWCTEIVERFCIRYHIIFLTGRGEEDRQVTERWLWNHVVLFPQPAWFSLMMRPADDHRPDTEVKTEIYKRDIEPKFDVLFAIDDRGRVIQMWRELGVPALQCDDWEEKSDPSIHKEIAKHFLTRKGAQE